MLRKLPLIEDRNVLVGTASNDDAAVYRLTDDQAIVATVDYFAPVVDDPYIFGQVAAANALSDIFAMGARPLFALNLVGFPRDKLPIEVLGEILRGGSDKAAEAGIAVLGGHSIDDPEPKYGMAVIGLVHPDRVLRNIGAQPGDALVLTKPLGSGVLTTGIKRGLVSPEDEDRIVRVMATLNRAAADAALAVGVHAVTDITGFGLLGHLRELALGSGVGAILTASAIPVLDAVWPLVREGVYPGGSQRNLDHVAGRLHWSPDVPDAYRIVLADAQTSGGLLIALPATAAARLLDELEQRGVQGARIGEIVADPTASITVRA